MIDFSIVVPVFQSKETLPVIASEVEKAMKNLQSSYELIFVDDSASNISWPTLLELRNNNPEHIKVIRLAKNIGQNGATICGIENAFGNKIITLDDDLQIHPSEIELLIKANLEHNADVVYGIYKAESGWLRKQGSNFVKWIFSKNQNGAPLGSSFRLLDKHIVDGIKFHSQDHLFINQIIHWYTSNYAFVEVAHNPRENGKSGYSFLDLIKLTFKLVFYYTDIPLKLIVYSCLFSMISCAAIVIYHFLKHQTADLSWVFLVMGLGLVLGSISILALFVNRIYSSRVKKPTYSIKSKL